MRSVNGIRGSLRGDAALTLCYHAHHTARTAREREWRPEYPHVWAPSQRPGGSATVAVAVAVGSGGLLPAATPRLQLLPHVRVGRARVTVL